MMNTFSSKKLKTKLSKMMDKNDGQAVWIKTQLTTKILALICLFSNSVSTLRYRIGDSGVLHFKLLEYRDYEK